MAPAELVAVGFGIAYILLAIRQHRACWIAGGISTAIYAFVLLDAELPMLAALQLLYVALSFYGWHAWGKDDTGAALVRRWPVSFHIGALGAIALATAASAPLAAQFALTAAPVADSLGTWASVLATWLLARRVIDAWIWWVLIDIGLAALFASRDLLPTAALHLGYALLAVAGWRHWLRQLAAG